MKEIDGSVVKRVQILDKILMCMLYVIQACALGFVMAYLLDKGCTSSEVGVLSAGFAILTAVLQPVLGRLADRSQYFDWKKQLLIISVGVEVTAVLALIFQTKTASAILFGLFMVGVNCMNPFVFASPFYYERYGIKVDFGKIRALGSISYALGSYAMGVLIRSFGNTAVPYAVVVTCAIFAVIVYLLPRFEDKPLSLVKKRKENPEGKLIEEENRGFFAKKYPTFIAMVIAVFLILYEQNVASAYLTQIVNHAGGDTHTVGVCGAIGAFCEVPMIFFFSKLAEKFTVDRMILFGAIGFLIRMIVFLFANNVPMALFGSALSGISFAIIAPAIVYYADHNVDTEDKNTAQSYMAMALMVSGIAANLISGVVYDNLGYSAMILVAIVIGVLGILFTMAAIRKGNAAKREN